MGVNIFLIIVVVVLAILLAFGMCLIVVIFGHEDDKSVEEGKGHGERTDAGMRGERQCGVHRRTSMCCAAFGALAECAC